MSGSPPTHEDWGNLLRLIENLNRRIESLEKTRESEIKVMANLNELVKDLCAIVYKKETP